MYIILVSPFLFFVLYAKIQAVSHRSIVLVSTVIAVPLEKDKGEDRGVERAERV